MKKILYVKKKKNGNRKKHGKRLYVRSNKSRNREKVGKNSNNK